MGDVTYLPTATGWCYLAVVLDAWSRRVVGWALGHADHGSAHARGARAGPHDAAAPRRACCITPIAGSSTRAPPTGRRWPRQGMVASMSRRGDCWDNAVVESFFASLKDGADCTSGATPPPEEAEADVRDYIERFYNRQRRHSTLGHLSPALYELRYVA